MEKFIFVKAYILASLKMWVALKYDPDQPRVPAGNETGGEWTSEGGKPFVGSKVNNILYHGTNANFDKFDASYQGTNPKREGAIGDFGTGIYFTDNKTRAGLEGQYIKEVYLDMKNPFNMSGISTENLMSLVNASSMTFTDEQIKAFDLKLAYYEFTWVSEGSKFSDLRKFFSEEDITELIKKAGYDGVIAPLSGEYVVFSDNQINILKNKKE